MASAFDELSTETAIYVRRRLLAGDSMAAIRDGYKQSIGAALMRRLRDEVFEPLKADPEAVKALAAGPVLNAQEIVKYKAPPRKPATGPEQIEMFS